MFDSLGNTRQVQRGQRAGCNWRNSLQYRTPPLILDIFCQGDKNILLIDVKQANRQLMLIDFYRMQNKYSWLTNASEMGGECIEGLSEYLYSGLWRGYITYPLRLFSNYRLGNLILELALNSKEKERKEVN